MATQQIAAGSTSIDSSSGGSARDSSMMHRPDAKQLDHLRSLALAFLMSTHPRLGQRSIVFTLENNVIQMIAEEVIRDVLHDFICDGYLGLLFQHIGTDNRLLRSEVAGVLLAGHLVRGRILSKKEAERVMTETGTVSGQQQSLHTLVWDVRRRVQEHMEEFCCITPPGYTVEDGDDDEDTVAYILLEDEGCQLLRADEIRTQCCLVQHEHPWNEQQQQSDGNDGWDNSAHIFGVSQYTYDVSAHAKVRTLPFHRVARSRCAMPSCAVMERETFCRDVIHCCNAFLCCHPARDILSRRNTLLQCFPVLSFSERHFVAT